MTYARGASLACGFSGLRRILRLPGEHPVREQARELITLVIDRPQQRPPYHLEQRRPVWLGRERVHKGRLRRGSDISGDAALRWNCVGRCRSFESAAGESLALSPAGLFDRTVPSREGFRP